MDEYWKSDLEGWLAPFLAALRHKVRARMCPAYVAGLIGAGDRKSIQPMAARDGGVGYDQLHHFIASGVWDAAPLEKALLAEADRMVGGAEAWLIVDDTALPKKGERSVGVAPQYASALGKNANCQTLVSLTLASGEVPVMVGLRLFLPESWTSDPARLTRAGVPDDHGGYRTKPEIALAEIDRARTAGLRFGCVLADAGYGLSAPFRQGLSERGLTWAVGVGGRQKVCGPHLSRRRARAPAQEPCARRKIGIGGEDAGDRALAHAELATWHQGAAEGPLRRRADQGGRRAAPEDRRHGAAASAGRRGLADRRTSLEWRAQILPLEPARRHLAQAPGRRDQGALDLRAGASAVEGGTRARPLRGTIMDGAASARAHDHDCLCLPSISAPQAGEAGKKEARARHPSPPFRPSARLSSPPSNGHHQHDVRTAADHSLLKFCQSSASVMGLCPSSPSE
nr:transposase [Rhizobiaceae bacterium]